MILPLVLVAQTDKQYEQLAQATCACASKKDLKGMSKSEVSMELGMCMLSSLDILPEKDRKNFDFTDPAKGKAIGEKIGMKMATFCPKTILIVASNISEEGNSGGSTQPQMPKNMPPPPPPVSVEGKIKEVIEGDFVTLVLVEANGREHKLIWEKHFTGDDPFVANPQNLKNKDVTVSYYMSERYLPKMREYFSLKHIAALTVK